MSRWILIDDGENPSGTWVPLDWRRRMALVMFCGGCLGFVAGGFFQYVLMTHGH